MCEFVLLLFVFQEFVNVKVELIEVEGEVKLKEWRRRDDKILVIKGKEVLEFVFIVDL